MKTTTTQLRDEILRTKHELANLEAALQHHEASCPHNWLAPVSDPIVRPGYHDPGDPVGTMGIDRRLPMDVPTQRTPRWRRECETCGKVEYTTSAIDRVTKVPNF